MATASKVREGNVYAIPGGGQYAFAKVVYLSEYFKDAIFILLHEKAFASGAEAPSNLQSIPSRGIYTGIDSAKRGEWILVGNSPVTPDEKARTRRLVGGDVWIEDVHMGPPSTAEEAKLPNMDIYGHRLIEKAVARLAQ